MQFSFLNEPTGTANGNQVAVTGIRKPGTKEWRQIHASIPDSEWEFRFQQLLDLHLIDVPDNFYDDKLFFTNPNDLQAHFDRL